jgi:hypothetical protein
MYGRSLRAFVVTLAAVCRECRQITLAHPSKGHIPCKLSRTPKAQNPGVTQILQPSSQLFVPFGSIRVTLVPLQDRKQRSPQLVFVVH